MPIDVEEEVISALGSPKGREILAEVFETVLERRARVAASPVVGAQEAAKMIGVKSKSERHLAKALWERCRRDAELHALRRKMGGRVVFDRAALVAYIQAHTQGGQSDV